MNYKTLKQAIVDTGYMTKKGLVLLILRVVVSILLLSIMVAIATSTFLNSMVAVGVIVVGGIMFIEVFNFIVEDEANLKLVNKISYFWFVPIPLIIGEIALLHNVLGVI